MKKFYQWLEARVPKAIQSLQPVYQKWALQLRENLITILVTVSDSYDLPPHNPITNLITRTPVSLKDDNYVNDLEYWINATEEVDNDLRNSASDALEKAKNLSLDIAEMLYHGDRKIESAIAKLFEDAENQDWK